MIGEGRLVVGRWGEMDKHVQRRRFKPGARGNFAVVHRRSPKSRLLSIRSVAPRDPRFRFV